MKRDPLPRRGGVLSVWLAGQCFLFVFMREALPYFCRLAELRGDGMSQEVVTIGMVVLAIFQVLVGVIVTSALPWMFRVHGRLSAIEEAISEIDKAVERLFNTLASRTAEFEGSLDRVAHQLHGIELLIAGCSYCQKGKSPLQLRERPDSDKHKQ